MATISIPEARVLSIKPFDRSSIGNIEKAIYEANIGLTPNNNGEQIQNLVNEYNKKVDEKFKIKESELLTI